MNVSTASIRNWIKTGYLDLVDKAKISNKSLSDFKKNIAGVEKLNQRANKSLFDTHDHKALEEEFIRKIYCGVEKGVDISNEYEKSLSNTYKNKEGIYYTPIDVAESFFSMIHKNKESLIFCDPCCGSGNFLLAAIKSGIRPENIYGYDTDLVAVELSKKRIQEETGYVSENIICGDFLKLSSSAALASEKYDIICTNPPWGKKLSKEKKKEYSLAFGAGKSVDTSALFFFSCLHRLNDNGYIGMLLQEAFFNISTFQDVRRKALESTVVWLVDYGKVFPTLLTKAKGILVQLKKPKNDSVTTCKTLTRTHIRHQRSFRDNPNQILNFTHSPKSEVIIDHMLKKPHQTLLGNARWGLGIVTGNNKKYCVPEKQTGYIPAYKGSEIKKDGLGSPSVYIPKDLSKYQQVAPKEIYEAKEKLIYRFISSDLVFYRDTAQTYVLNSANMLIINDDFPLSAKQIQKLLNSEIINWYFKAIFNTHKILRADIEKIPIYIDYYRENKEFTEDSFLEYLGIKKEGPGQYKIK